MKQHFYHYLLATAIAISVLSSCASRKQSKIEYSDSPKREFRGAWISTAWQSRYQAMNSEQMKAYFIETIDQLHKDGINAIIFQVRPYADAFYKSDLEPWSAFLTGTQGKAPDNNFDPLTFLIEECHKRNIELHAWLNPYRVSAGTSDVFAENHIYKKRPDLFVSYGDKIYFDPGYPENRKFICDIVKDITKRYDIDAIHMDDYFYPYPIAGTDFPDNRSFNMYAKSQGFSASQRNDWRRNNVNLLIREIKEAIVVTKPWVRFGVSPFGIYRNKRTTPDGSETTGLQNYDDLYADIKLWVEKGWIDYNMPQLYWEIGHKAADYTTLIKWWSEHNYKQPLYIGQSVDRTMKVAPDNKSQLHEKMMLSRTIPHIHGNCFWPAYSLLDNNGGISDSLRTRYHKYPALIPAYTHMHNKRPDKVKNLREEYTSTQHLLRWDSNKEKDNPESAQYFVIYRSGKGGTDNARNIVTITRESSYILPYEGGKNKYKYIVTVVDAFHNESKGRTIKVAL